MPERMTALLAGALAGLLVTVLVTLVWPHGKLRWARPLVGAGLGVGVAYLVIQLM